MDGVTIYLNVSAHTAMQDNFTKIFADFVKDLSLKPGELGLEITETAELEDVKKAGESFKKLKDIGIPLAIDDFGAGYSSLSYLRDLPVDSVKLDKVFAKTISEKTTSELIKFVVSVCDTLSLNMLGEGIETDDQKEKFIKIGCPNGQGYLMHRPEFIEDLKKFVMEINKDKPSKGAEQILLAQIKQEFTAPADAIEQYIDLVSQYIEENNVAVEDEVEQIKMGQKKLLSQYEEAFSENTKSDSQKNKTAQEYSELRHNLRTPLNAIIGYSEILMEDFEDDLSESCINDLNNILSHSRETEKAIEKFVDFIKGDLKPEPTDESGQSNVKNAESLFKSLGDLIIVWKLTIT